MAGKKLHIIVALYKYVFWGGLQKDTLRMAEEAVKRGHKVTVFTTDWENPPDFITVEKCRVSGWSNVSRMKCFNNAWKERLGQGGFDVSVAMDRVEGADFYFAADSCLRTYYCKKYPRWYLAISPRHRFILDMEEKVCGAASRTRVWYISPFQREEYIAEYGTPVEHLLELPPGMNPACVRPAEDVAAKIRNDVRSELGLKGNELGIILVGTNVKRKGMDRLLDAVKSLPQEIRNLARPILVGNIPASEIQSFAGDIFDKCIITGPRKDVERLLLAADIMVHPAREEGTGTVLVEGIASGIPVLCTACCGFSPYVKVAAGLVVNEPFQQDTLNAMLRTALENLTQLTEQTRQYSKTQDFTSRQRVMLDYIENAASVK
ncbi:MAG: glycosyltransferase family 4 protein [Victivallales bacterium]|nr:glycosyltransferase family 4 protein [Victivallales bacterium]